MTLLQPRKVRIVVSPSTTGPVPPTGISSLCQVATAVPKSGGTGDHHCARLPLPPRAGHGDDGGGRTANAKHLTANVDRGNAQNARHILNKLVIESKADLLEGIPEAQRNAGLGLCSMRHARPAIASQGAFKFCARKEMTAAAALVPALDLSGAACAAGAPDTGNKLYWGPRVWRMLHLLAELSDRNDLYMLWPALLRQTAAVLPCATCRTHMGAYLRTHAVMQFRAARGRVPITGRAVKERVRKDLNAFHNDVNVRLGKPRFKAEDLAATYGAKKRPETLLEVQSLYEEIQAAWMPLTHIQTQGGVYTEWKRIFQMILALVSAGPTP
jgi:hypothetical protein